MVNHHTALGSGNTVKQAKHDAAKNLLEKLRQLNKCSSSTGQKTTAGGQWTKRRKGGVLKSREMSKERGKKACAGSGGR